MALASFEGAHTTTSELAGLGVDIGGTKLLGVRLDAAGNVVDVRKVATPRGAQAVVERVIEVATDLSAGGADDEHAASGRSGPAGATALSLGVGCPGMIDRAGWVRFAPNLHGLDGVDMASELRERWSGPVSVTNDATCAGWAEYRLGAAAGYHTALMVTLGTGIGGGLMTGGHLVGGANGFAGEFGHAVIDPNGPLCPCGQRGCWERFASGSGLGRLGREAAQAGLAPAVVALAGGDPESVRGEHVTRSASAGDQGAQAIMDRFAWWLALGLANLTNIFDPDAIILGGGLIEAGEVLMAPTRQAFGDLVEGHKYRRVAILPAGLGERAGAIGAALVGAGQ